MYAIIGLGNPGRKYSRTRHNAGWDVVELLADKWNMPLKKRKHKALIAEGRIHGQKVLLAQPQTYMNLSGESVLDIMQFYKPEHLLVLYDDIDLPPGVLRIRKQGGPGTHNGMRNIIWLLGTEDFPRIRIGIGKPAQPGMDLKDYVTSGYNTKAEREQAFALYLRAVDAVDLIVRENDIEAAMREFNGNGGGA